jgi:hypothetical protein
MARTPSNNLAERWLSQAGILIAPLWFLLVTTIITWGWMNRDQGYITAESGLGYWLGIIGSCMMLALLTYSLRKRVRALSRMLTIKFWFQLHMFLGIVGPVLILFHSNYQLGSLNSTVALVCMLLVAGSGIVGRYLYNQIHYGLYGERIKLNQVLLDFKKLKDETMRLTITDKQQTVARNIFTSMEELVTAQRDSQSFINTYNNLKKARKLSAALTSLIKHLDASHVNKGDKTIAGIHQIHNILQENNSILQAALKKLPSLQLSEWLFSIWHVIHIPIFILMIATAVVHIIVVHMY